MTLLAHRTRPLWIAALVHRLSGLALAVFLPFHFLALGLAISGEAQLESFLRWSEQPLVKMSEAVLLGVLAIHMLGGLRLLALENLAWREGQARLALLAVVAAMAVAFAFLASVF
ncbi:MAG: succinate dehydrogenase, cytochrome b subunit [Rhizobiales bacterium]|nr:succinate dehydrogenase, cytochrome b subunit [Hyphomicrobiales bacterium]